MVQVELVYAPLDLPLIQLHLNVSVKATVGDVVKQSGLLDSHPEIDGLAVGIFSEQVKYDTLIKQGDRIEIYRPLLIDPMEKRRQRALT